MGQQLHWWANLSFNCEEKISIFVGLTRRVAARKPLLRLQNKTKGLWQETVPLDHRWLEGDVIKEWINIWNGWLKKINPRNTRKTWGLQNKSLDLKTWSDQYIERGPLVIWSGCLPELVFCACPTRRGNPGKTKNTLERLCLLTVLGTTLKSLKRSWRKWMDGMIGTDLTHEFHWAG